jgi:acyl-coenzyme A thioesterase PaaI-like protein
MNFLMSSPRAYEYHRAHPALLVGTTSGLETVQLTWEGKLPTPPIVATLGISLVEAAAGRAVLEGSPAEWQYNQLATVNGGWLSALLDSALGYAVHTVCPQVAASPRSICMFGSCAP